MIRRIRTLAFLLFPTLALSVQTCGAACQCPPLTPKEQASQATYIVNADVWDVAMEKSTKQRVITFDANDFFKGKIKDAHFEVRDNEEGTECATDFKEGETYLVFVSWRWGTMLTSRCWGTKLLKEIRADQNSIGASDAMKSKYYDHLHNLCMGRRDTPCCLNSLKVMRDGGYLPQPEQGCPDETIPDRLRCDGSYVWCLPTLEPHRHNK